MNRPFPDGLTVETSYGHRVGAALASYVVAAVYDLKGADDWAFSSARILGILAAAVLAIRASGEVIPATASLGVLPAAGEYPALLANNTREYYGLGPDSSRILRE